MMASKLYVAELKLDGLITLKYVNISLNRSLLVTFSLNENQVSSEYLKKKMQQQKSVIFMNPWDHVYFS